MRNVISTLSEKLHNGEISSLELTKKYIEETEKINPKTNAYIYTSFDYAIECAKKADVMLKSKDAPILCGIPMAIKDNICTEGLNTTCCSKMLRGFKPNYDATVWDKLKSMGAVLIGKTNMDEFGMGSTSDTSCYGITKNPINIQHIAGGSSGGSAAAVCANIAAYALGTDTGGSIRQPASHCGVVGLKPSYGAVSRYGLIAYASSLDCVGTITSSVTDAETVFEAIKGKDLRDLTTVEYDIQKTPQKLRVGISDKYLEGTEKGVQDAIRKAIGVFEENGAEITEINLPDLNEAVSAYYIIVCAQSSSNLARYDGVRYGYRTSEYSDIEDMISRTRSEAFSDEVKRRIMLGTYVLSGGNYDKYYRKALDIRNNIIKAFNDVFLKCDIILAPVSSSAAPRIDAKDLSPVQKYESDKFTVPVSVAGLCAMSLPAGVDGNGLPVGIQIIGNRFCENTVFMAAKLYEDVVGDTVKGYSGGVRI